MTKTIIIGEQAKDSTKNPIQFSHMLMDSWEFEETMEKPSYFRYVELICKEYSPDADLMFAYNDPTQRSNGIMFAGRWNDGVVK